jgi:hypothetical protein
MRPKGADIPHVSLLCSKTTDFESFPRTRKPDPQDEQLTILKNLS